MRTPDSLEELIQALRCLPGVGPKSATRMAYHLLQRDHAGAGRLATALGESVKAAQAKAYEVAAKIHFDGAQYRKDIGYRAL